MHRPNIWRKLPLTAIAALALTGLTASPGIFDVLITLGRERSLARIDHAVRYIGGRSSA